jgi:Predicted nucleotide-binding protein containing TIR-like domain
MKPKMFIASSAEHLDLAYAVQEGLERDVEATVWSQGVFAPSRTAMASLIDVLDENDFGVFVLAPSDVAIIRKETKSTVRDNVIFELGLFIGRLGSDRCFLVVPREAEDLHLPTDLLGLTPVTFEPNREDANLTAALGPACNRIRKAVTKLGIANTPSSVAVPTPASDDELFSDKNDCLSLIQSWMGGRPSGENRAATRYDDVDRLLKMKAGSARLYIEEAAQTWDYSVERKGEQTIKFKDRSRS